MDTTETGTTTVHVEEIDGLLVFGDVPSPKAVKQGTDEVLVIEDVSQPKRKKKVKPLPKIKVEDLTGTGTTWMHPPPSMKRTDDAR